jgi:MFS family permease
LALHGFGAGNAQLAAFSLPELLPNKWRHIAVVIADAGVYLSLIVGPVAGRFAIRRGDDWRWLLYGPAIITFVSFCLLVWLYFPPKHPRGIPWNQALRELDYIRMVLFVAGTVLILTGIVYTTTVPSFDPKVIATLGKLCSRHVEAEVIF